MYKSIKKTVITFAAVLMMASGVTIVEAAEFSQAGGYVEIVPFVSSCTWRVERIATAATNSNGSGSNGQFGIGTIVSCDLNVHNGRRLVTGVMQSGRIGSGWVVEGNLS